MKLSLISALVAGAGIVQVAAVPIRVVIISKTTEGFHHPVPENVATLNIGEGNQFDKPIMPTKFKHHHGCNGRMNRFRQKGIEISNAFRQALGMPLIEESHPRIHEHKHIGPNGGGVRILPLMPPTADSYRTLRVSNLPHPHHAPDVPGSHIHHRPHHYVSGGPHSSFTNRLHHSLMNLGRWEGRAVAFVLGCGIGVLLRMFWVIAIVAYRSFKGSNEDEDEYSHIAIIEEYEEGAPVHSAPPSYTYPVDEKVAIETGAPVESK